jgi:hypothetical protein
MGVHLMKKIMLRDQCNDHGTESWKNKEMNVKENSTKGAETRR